MISISSEAPSLHTYVLGCFTDFCPLLQPAIGSRMVTLQDPLQCDRRAPQCLAFSLDYRCISFKEHAQQTFHGQMSKTLLQLENLHIDTNTNKIKNTVFCIVCMIESIRLGLEIFADRKNCTFHGPVGIANLYLTVTRSHSYYSLAAVVHCIKAHPNKGSDKTLCKNFAPQDMYFQGWCTIKPVRYVCSLQARQMLSLTRGHNITSKPLISS